MHGDKYYYSDGSVLDYWREDGPAIDYAEDYGRKHRLDGPALILPNGSKEYWIDNQKYTHEQWRVHPLVIEYAINKENSR